MMYQTGPGQNRDYDFDKEIRRVARLHSTSEEYINHFPLEDAADFGRRLGTPKYLMSTFESGYEDGRRWCPAVKFRRDVFVDEREELESSNLPASDRFHPDPVNHLFLLAVSNVYWHHFDIPFFKYLSTSMTTAKLPIDARSAAETRSSKPSLLTRLRAL